MKIPSLLIAFTILSLSCAHISAANRVPSSSLQSQSVCPWLNKSWSTEKRLDEILKVMNQEQKMQLIFGYFAKDLESENYHTPALARPFSAGYIPGIESLCIPSQWQTDAGVGVATQITNTPRERVALPSGIATAATWNPKLAYAGGKMIGHEARISGFNVQLAGGINLAREARNGRNFEYAGEDPLLAGIMVGEEIRGIQSNHIISTIKHFAINNQETDRTTVDALIDPAAARVSDLLAFQLAIEKGDPGSVMCSYNIVNHVYACENEWLLNDVLKTSWKYQGYVMSDWGAAHSAIQAANSGLDQESGFPFDKQPFFQDPLSQALKAGLVSQQRLDDMVSRILRQMFAKGLFDDPVTSDLSEQIDYLADGKISQADAEEAMVLLKNKNALLPLQLGAKRIAIIGGHADVGVLSGGGSSQVYPVGGSPVANEGPGAFPGPKVFYPSSMLNVLRQKNSGPITYVSGRNLSEAVTLAEQSDTVIVFATQWTAESLDAGSLSLPDGQDELISAVAKTNPHTVVVLETGGAVTMPWLNQVGAVLEAWYPGTRGGEAIARVLIGEVNPSGHLPVSFPAAESQLPRAKIESTGLVDYNIEGAAVGYKWFDSRGLTPLFPFGYGLSYTSFKYSNLKLAKGQIQFQMKNQGGRAGHAVAQVYVSGPKAWEAPKRLVGWRKLALAPGEKSMGHFKIDPRLLAIFDSKVNKWKILAGDYSFTLAESARSQPAGRIMLHLSAKEWTDGSLPDVFHNR
jgi:beta-glucosidase